MGNSSANVEVNFVNEMPEMVKRSVVSKWKPYGVFGYKEIVTFRTSGKVVSMSKTDFESVFKVEVEVY